MPHLDNNKIDFGVLLASHGLRKTMFRMELLKLFYESKNSLSVDEVVKSLSSSINKVTIYRALESFEKSGLTHLVPDRNKLTRYSLCPEECTADLHLHNHCHFICHSCDQTFCLDHVKSPDISDMKGFNVKKLTLTLEGYCQECYTN
jgi:Fur family transcriptional regulator, ferric uptake regulator